MSIPFEVNPKIVRGLDYYSRTVFEFIVEGFPTVIGGGRYDGLIEQIGGSPTPAVGCGSGMDRLLILLKEQGLLPENLTAPCDIYVGHAGDEGYEKSQALAYELKLAGIIAESDMLKRSVKAQLKYAGKRGARFSMVVGCNEIADNSAKLKNMETGEQISIELSVEAITKEINK
jgi:histidyl-tRNA synthetase